MSSDDDPVAQLLASASEPPQRDSRRRAPVDLALTATAYVALLIAMLPLTRVVASGMWTVGVLFLPLLIFVAGTVARRFRLPAAAVSLAEAVVGVLALTVVFLGDSALLGILPTPRSFTEAAGLFPSAFDQIVNGAAPLQAGTGLSFLLVAGAVVLAIIVDHVVLTARMPLLAAVALVAVWLIPSIAVPRETDVVSFVLLAVAILVLLRLDTRGREKAAAFADTDPVASARVSSEARAGSAGITAAAAGIGAVAVIVTLVVAPVFSGAVIRTGEVAGGRFNSIDASLALGDDLRTQSTSEVLRYRTTSASAPYLRVATLSNFDGEIWRADRGRTVPLQSEGAYTAVQRSEDIRILDATTSIEIENLSSASAPVTFPAVSVEGLDGDWGVIPFNGTVVSRTASVNGQRYDVSAEYARPTLEQVRASEAGAAGVPEASIEVPADVPGIIAELAQAVTGETTTDYDALAALQRWFRSGEFAYSLEAPVEEGFDGSGAEAIAEFLEVREGYCIHFASAFALMSRTLGMPSRIVVGYLPGSAMSGPVTGDRVYSVLASQLHAWPEVHFSGIGWIPFEPTNSLGAPTSFSPAATLTDTEDGQEEAAAPSDAPTPTASARPDDIDDLSSGTSSVNPLALILPWLWPLLVILALASAPAVVRVLRRRTLLSAAQHGDAVAAWRSLQEDAIDLGIRVPPDESPRAFGARLVETHGVPVAAMDMLVEAIELASYAPDVRRRWRADGLDAAVVEARSGLRSSATNGMRIVSIVVPRSLLIRPGSVYAGDGIRERVRSR